MSDTNRSEPGIALPAQRIPALEGLRALAVSIVFLRHAFPSHVMGGYVGVDLFFVISGFVITASLMRDSIDFRRFYVHRFFRIVPPMIPVLIFVLIVGGLGVTLAAPSDALFSLFSVMNWARAFEQTSGLYLGHFWSLSVEEQFYLVWPLALLLILRTRLSVSVALTAVLIALVAWQAWLFQSGAAYERIYNGLDTRASQILIGCLLYFVLDRIKVGSTLAVWALTLLLLAAFTISSNSEIYLGVGIVGTGLLSAILVANVVQQEAAWHAVLLNRPAQWIGSRSYAIYLWHFPIIGLLRSTTLSPLMVALLAALFTGLAAELSMRWVEAPARTIRSHFDAPRIRSLKPG